MSARACIKEILLSEYLDGELPEEAGKNVREHLLGCRNCSDAYERMKADRSLLLECLPDPNPPSRLRQPGRRRRPLAHNRLILLASGPAL